MAEIITADNVKIWIDDASSVGTDLLSGEPSNRYEASVTNIDVSGGAKDIDSIATFGGFLDKGKPREQLEISFDVIIRLDSSDATVATQWDSLNDGGATKRVVAIQGGDGTKGFYWNAFNNASVINFDKEFAAEDEWKGTINLKLSYTDEDANPNVAIGSHATAEITDATNGLIAADWTS